MVKSLIIVISKPAWCKKHLGHDYDFDGSCSVPQWLHAGWNGHREARATSAQNACNIGAKRMQQWFKTG